MLSIKNLTVKAKKEILKNINLEIKQAERIVIFGPNGSGKSTLFKVLMGLGNYKIKKGDIQIDGESVTGKSIDERVKLGLGYIGQKGVGVKGVTVEDLMNEYNFEYEDIKKTAKELDIEELLNRDINYTLSGGEIKRVELFTLSLLPDIDVYLLDELDSGVDLDNIGRISKYLNNISKKKSIVLTTHTGAILEKVKMDTAYVMLDGEIVCKNTPKKVWKCITENGYEGCVNCDISNI